VSLGNAIEREGYAKALETLAAWLLAVVWLLPLLFALWTAFHPSEFRPASCLPRR